MYLPKLFILSCSLFTGSTLFATTTDTIPVKDLKIHFESGKIVKNKLIVPNIKKYKVELIGSDNQSVIDLKGNVYQPLIDKQVNVLFKITDKKNQEVFAEIPTKGITVKGLNGTKASANKKPFVIPALREWVGGEGYYTLTAQTKIIYSDTSATSKQVAELLQEDIAKLLAIKLEIKPSSNAILQKGDILIGSSKEEALGREGYRLKIGDVIELSAPAHAGKVFGTRTILQLLEQDKHNLRIVRGEARDYPAYEVRGLVLDVGRKFFSLAFLNKYIEFMSYYKMSNFHIHLNDNGFKQYFGNDWDKTYSGFRLESETYPNLASKDGHYTKKEFIELQKKALRYGVTIIPEIDVPAHSLAIVKAVPEIGSQKYGMDHLDLNNPKTFEVVKNIFDEYTKGDNPVFIGKEVHVGTDEYDKAESEKFRAFTDFVFKTVQDNGKDVRAWGALTHAQGKTPVRSKNVTLNSWYNGYGEPREMKKLGYKQISTPDGYLYIVPFAGYYYDYLNTDYLYNSWSPRQIGNVTFEKGDPIVRGGMFAVWNDIVGNGISEQDVHNRVYPAMQVLAQKMWGAEDEKPRLFEFNLNKGSLSEAPGLNMRGNYQYYKAGLIYHLPFQENLNNAAATDLAAAESTALPLGNDKKYFAQFDHEQATLKLPIQEIGEQYTVSFWINPSYGFGGDLFTSSNAKVFYNENGLGYERDGYIYSTDIKLTTDKWSLISVTGDKTGTQFYINGRLAKDMKPAEVILPTKDGNGKEVKFNKIQTLVFPLETITLKHAKLSDLRIFNIKLNPSEIADLFSDK